MTHQQSAGSSQQGSPPSTVSYLLEPETAARCKADLVCLMASVCAHGCYACGLLNLHVRNLIAPVKWKDLLGIIFSSRRSGRSLLCLNSKRVWRFLILANVFVFSMSINNRLEKFAFPAKMLCVKLKLTAETSQKSWKVANIVKTLPNYKNFGKM